MYVSAGVNSTPLMLLLEVEILSLTYKVLLLNRPTVDLCAAALPHSLFITNRSFRYASPCLVQLPASFSQLHHITLFHTITLFSSHPCFNLFHHHCHCLLFSLFHSRLKTHPFSTNPSQHRPWTIFTDSGVWTSCSTIFCFSLLFDTVSH